MAKSEDFSTELMKLGVEDEDLFSKIVSTIEPVSGTVLYFSSEDVEFVSPGDITRQLYTREGSSVNDTFGQYDFDSVRDVRDVLEYGLEPATSSVRKRRALAFPEYSVSNYGFEDHEEVISSVHEAYRLLNQGQFRLSQFMSSEDQYVDHQQV